MSEELVPACPDANPTALARLAHVGERVAQGLAHTGLDGLSEKARRNLVATGASAIGCGVSLLIVAFILIANAMGFKGNDEVAATPPPSVVDSMKLAQGEKLYRVKSGDTLSEIAEANGVTLSELETRDRALLDAWHSECLANAVFKPGACEKVVFLGRDLPIPAHTTTPAATAATTQVKN